MQGESSQLQGPRLTRRFSDASWRTSGDGEDSIEFAAIRPVTPRTWAATTGQDGGRGPARRISLYSNSLFANIRDEPSTAAKSAGSSSAYVPLSHRPSLSQRPSTSYTPAYGGGPSIASPASSRPDTPSRLSLDPHLLLASQGVSGGLSRASSSQQGRHRSSSLRPLSPPTLPPIPTPALPAQRALGGGRPSTAPLALARADSGRWQREREEVERREAAGWVDVEGDRAGSREERTQPAAAVEPGVELLESVPAASLKGPGGPLRVEINVDARGGAAGGKSAEPSPVGVSRIPGAPLKRVATSEISPQSSTPRNPFPEQAPRQQREGHIPKGRPASAGAPFRGSPQGTMSRELASVYDPNLEEPDPAKRVQRKDPALRLAKQPSLRIDASTMSASSPGVDIDQCRSFLVQAGPGTGPIQCFIIRDRRRSRLYPQYTLYLDMGHKFLLAARKRKKSKSANYLMSLDEHDLARHSSSFCGKLRGNFFGTEFSCYNRGAKPGRGVKACDLREELASVAYTPNLLGSKGPRRMSALIPQLDAAGNPTSIQPSRLEETMRERFKAGREEGLVAMRNKPPRWNEQLHAYCLNFGGRVTHASVKNFQLVAPGEDPEHIILQFGKVGLDVFTMDYQAPISAMQAFAICLSALDNKLACE